MAYSKSTKFGCAFKTCGEQFIVTCLYNHVLVHLHLRIERKNCSNAVSNNENSCDTFRGNRPDTELWESGQPCRSNGDCTTYEGSTCSNGLCIDSANKADVTFTRNDKKPEEKKPSEKGEENHTGEKGLDRSTEEGAKKGRNGQDEKKKPSEQGGIKQPNEKKIEKETNKGKPSDDRTKVNERKPKEDANGDKPNSSASMCPGSKITAEARQLFLALHNNERRNIALGKAPNNVGFLGPAKNMYKMVSSSKISTKKIGENQ